jgi:phosphonate transport system ATP-binding protein
LACSAASYALKEVTVGFGTVRALDGVSLEVAPGEAVAFVGPSGAGKTTLLRLLNGTVRPTEGTVAMSGRVLSSLSAPELREVRSCIGVIYQDLDLVPNLRVIKNVLAGRLGRWSLASSVRAMLLPSRGEVREVYELLDRVGIPDKLYQRTDRLSGGERQRVAVARSLFQQPSVLLADEPVSSVDPARARETVRLLLEISREWGLTLVMSLHHIDLAQELFGRMIGLREGRVLFDSARGDVGSGQLEELYQLEPAERSSAHAVP